MIEGLLLVDKFIDQVAIIADQRKYVSDAYSTRI